MLGERCVTSKKRHAKETNYWSEEKQTTIIHIHLVFTYCCAGGRINEVCPVATCQKAVTDFLSALYKLQQMKQ